VSFLKSFEKTALDPKTVRKLYESGLTKRIAKSGLPLQPQLRDAARRSAVSLSAGYDASQTMRTALKKPMAAERRASGQKLLEGLRNDMRALRKSNQEKFPKK
jgi:hypothetical protein